MALTGRADAPGVKGELDPAARPLEVYVPRLAVEWLSERPDLPHLALDGTMALADISGFTALTERLARQGERGGEFFVLLDGEAEVRRNGRKRATVGPGEFFGEIALVSDRPRTATVTATKPVRVLVITDASFRAVLN